MLMIQRYEALKQSEIVSTTVYALEAGGSSAREVADSLPPIGSPCPWHDETGQVVISYEITPGCRSFLQWLLRRPVKNWKVKATIGKMVSRQASEPMKTMKEVHPHDWEEDAWHENGNYRNVCAFCGTQFTGHKRRMICRICFKNAEPKAPPGLGPSCG